jgi:TatD DNase family protein
VPDEGQSLLALAEQRGKQAAAQLNRVCSARYKLDLALEAKKISIHAVLRGIEKRPGEIFGLDEGMIRPMWIDTHCHLDAPEFESDRDQVVVRSRAARVDSLVIPSVERSNLATVRELAHRVNGAYALGIHPLYVDRAVEEDLQHVADALREFQADPRLVAVGEIGLDHFVPHLDLAKQEHFYVAQLKLAQQFKLPVILHVRRSADALLKQLRRHPVAGGIAHAFNGSEQQAMAFVDMGFKLGFGGALTFDRALQIRRLAQTLPLSCIVLETDAPDIPPHWLYRTAAERALGMVSRNEPAELPRIAKVLADLRGMSLEALAEATTANAMAALPRLASLPAMR